MVDPITGLPLVPAAQPIAQPAAQPVAQPTYQPNPYAQPAFQPPLQPATPPPYQPGPYTQPAAQPIAPPAAYLQPATPPVAPPVAQPIAPPATYLTPPPASPAPIAPPAPASPAPIAPPLAPTTPLPPVLQVPADQFQSLMNAQTQLAQLQAAQEAERQQRAQADAEARLRQGQLEEGIQQLRQQGEQALQAERNRVAEIQSQAQHYALDNELSNAVAGYTFASPNAREMFISGIRGQFLVEPQGRTFAVRTPTFQSARDYVAQALAHKDNQYLLAPNGVAGTQAGQTPQLPPAAPPPAAPGPQASFWNANSPNLGQAVLAEMQAQRAAMPHGGHPGMNLQAPMGLHRAMPRPQ